VLMTGWAAVAAGTGHGCRDVYGVLPAIPTSDTRDAQVVPGVYQRLQDHLRLQAVRDRSTGRANEHGSDEADRGDRVG